MNSKTLWDIEGYKLRFRDCIGEKKQYFIDPLLHFEYHGKPDFLKHEIETKPILAKETGRIIAAFSPVSEIEIRMIMEVGLK